MSFIAKSVCSFSILKSHKTHYLTGISYLDHLSLICMYTYYLTNSFFFLGS